MGVYEIEIAEGALEEISKFRAFDGRQILGAIEKQLTQEPTVETRNRKLLPGLVPPFESLPPIWELRVGEYRVFYDVNADQKKVYVRMVRRKPPHRTTQEIL